MRYINIYDHHDNKGIGSCSTCCCEPIGMRPGEIQLVTMNYAPWVIPIMANGGPGLVPTPEFSVTENSEGCSSQPIDGFSAPSVGGLIFNNPLNVTADLGLVIDLASDVAPATNTFEYRLVPVSGPSHGSLTTPLDGENWDYTPEPGFNGYDQFWVEIKDAQGRKLIRPVNLRVGTPQGIAPFGWGPNAVIGVQIDRSQVQINSHQQTISFPMMLPPSNGCDTVDGCKHYRVTIKAYARDCERLFSHITCLDVNCAKC